MLLWHCIQKNVVLNLGREETKFRTLNIYIFLLNDITIAIFCKVNENFALSRFSVFYSSNQPLETAPIVIVSCFDICLSLFDHRPEVQRILLGNIVTSFWQTEEGRWKSRRRGLGLNFGITTEYGNEVDRIRDETIMKDIFSFRNFTYSVRFSILWYVFIVRMITIARQTWSCSPG